MRAQQLQNQSSYEPRQLLSNEVCQQTLEASADPSGVQEYTPAYLGLSEVSLGVFLDSLDHVYRHV